MKFQGFFCFSLMSSTASDSFFFTCAPQRCKGSQKDADFLFPAGRNHVPSEQKIVSAVLNAGYTTFYTFAGVFRQTIKSEYKKRCLHDNQWRQPKNTGWRFL
jgi:hypothetical protein